VEGARLDLAAARPEGARRRAEAGLALVEERSHSGGFSGAGPGAAAAGDDGFGEACRRAEEELLSVRLASCQPLLDRLKLARRVRVLGLPPGTPSAALEKYLGDALGPAHGPAAVLSTRAVDGGGWGGDSFTVFVELGTAALAVAALALEARGPSGGALEIRPALDATHMLSEHSAGVKAALTNAIVTGALLPDDFNAVDAWEALHLVDQSAAVEAIVQLAAVAVEGATGCIAGRVGTPPGRVLD